MKASRLTALAIIPIAATVALVPPASAKGGGDVRAPGSCSAGTSWKLKAKPDDGRIELELEIDSNRVGQTWAVTITDNGARVFAGSRVTAAPSGSFELRLRPANRAGTDSFVAAARNARTGETCRGGVRL